MEEIKELLIDRMAENLPVLRKKLRLSQDGLAQIIGTSRHTVMLLETKKRTMTWNTFLSLVFLFDKNEATSLLLRALDIYNSQLESIIIVDQQQKEM